MDGDSTSSFLKYMFDRINSQTEHNYLWKNSNPLSEIEKYIPLHKVVLFHQIMTEFLIKIAAFSGTENFQNQKQSWELYVAFSETCLCILKWFWLENTMFSVKKYAQSCFMTALNCSTNNSAFCLWIYPIKSAPNDQRSSVSSRLSVCTLGSFASLSCLARWRHDTNQQTTHNQRRTERPACVIH